MPAFSIAKAAGMARSTFYYHFRKSKQPDKYAREKEYYKVISRT
ncbi:MAG: TetR family transcriptional regulator [Alistipes finegoldii]